MKKNKLLLLLLAVSLLLSSFAFISCAGEGQTPSLRYRRIAGEEAYAVVGIGNVKDGEIVIPEKHKNFPVTQIADNAFSGCAGLTLVAPPESAAQAFAKAHGFAWQAP